MTDVIPTVAIDLLVILVSVVIGIIGFYLGSELKKHERKIDVLDETVDKHDREIKCLRTDVDGLLGKNK